MKAAVATRSFAEWLARGRSHQREGRAVDAMLCFRRALRDAPQSVDVRFHLGEVLWQLGCRALRVEKAREVLEGVAPGIPLIVHVRLQYGER